MQKHPDADAFIHEYLMRPTDATTRLVFADWLDETGAPHNAAWAHFIRLREQASRHDPDNFKRHKLLIRADLCAEKIRARLTVSAKRMVNDPESLLQLLPAAHITVRLTNYPIPRDILERVPEIIVRGHLAVHFCMKGEAILFATADPHNLDKTQKLGSYLDRAIVLVGSQPDEVIEAINRSYGYPEAQYANPRHFIGHVRE